MSSDPVTAYKNVRPKAQHLPGPGLEKDMDPPAEWTRQEAWDNEGNPYLREYVGAEKLKGKNAIITGSDSGIGRSAAILFAREGANVTLVYLPEEHEDGAFVKKAVEEAGAKCLLVEGDLKDRAFCKSVVDKHMAEFGSLEILVNNAAMQIYSEDVTELDLDDTERTFRTNILSQFALVKYAVPHLKRGAAIINSTSVGAYLGSAMAVKLDYASTKGAIVSFTRALALQLAPKQIRVNMVAPGPIWCPLNPATSKQPAEAMQDFSYKAVPLTGRMGMPAELGEAYVFLAGPGSSFVTGSCIHVNGGMWTGS